MQTGRLPGNRDGEIVLASEDQPLEVTLVLRKHTIGQLLAELSQLHSDRGCNCPGQHHRIDLCDPAVDAFVKGPLNGAHKQVDLRKCAFWLGSPVQYGPKLSVQNAANCLSAQEVINIVARAGNIPCPQLMFFSSN